VSPCWVHLRLKHRCFLRSASFSLTFLYILVPVAGYYKMSGNCLWSFSVTPVIRRIIWIRTVSGSKDYCSTIPFFVDMFRGFMVRMWFAVGVRHVHADLMVNLWSRSCELVRGRALMQHMQGHTCLLEDVDDRQCEQNSSWHKIAQCSPVHFDVYIYRNVEIST